MTRFSIAKLVLRGENLEDAMLEFSVGFNAVTGASDTGKSLAYHAINYALGASKMPPLPPEAKDYDRVFLELRQSDNKKTTVMRSFLPSEQRKIYVFSSEIDSIDINDYELYSTGSKAKKKYTDYLMNLFDCPYSTLLIANGEDSRTFTFRFFAHLIMLSETKVYATHSPIYGSDTTSDVSRPAALSAFHVLLKGADSPAPPKKEKVEISKAKLIGQKEQLEQLCSDLEKEIIGLKSLPGGWDYQNIEEEISRIENSVIEQRSNLERMQIDFTSQKQAMLELDEKRIRVHDTVLRLELLKKNYESDVERLEFIDEAHLAIDQFVDVHCPICHTVHTVHSSNKAHANFNKSLDAEKRKLTKQLSDLSEAIAGFLLEESTIKSNITVISEIITSRKKEIDNLLRGGLKDTLNELEEYQKSRDSFVETGHKEETLSEYKSLIDILAVQIESSKKSKKTTGNSLPSYLDELGDFCYYISVYLSNWNFSKENITFNQSEQDLVVGNKEKRAWGQGARAIINSAFILALLEFSIKKGYAHPGVVMIDSPLTTFKDKDNDNKTEHTETDDIPLTVKQAFFSHLSETPHDRQVIVFDNEEPSEKAENATYHHFSGNSQIGRAGFIPPRAQISILE